MIAKTLKKLVDNYDIVGLKTSFEDEGVKSTDLYYLIKIATKYGIETALKIGGCEAKSDLRLCKEMDIDNVVAPMVESGFATTKFISAVSERYSSNCNVNFYVNIETQNAVNNCKSIISSGKDFLKGIVVGRSDLAKSLGLTKEETNSDEIFDLASKVFEEAKKYNLQTVMGGNVNINGRDFISKMYSSKLLDKIETRLVICKVNDYLIENFSEFVNLSIELEKLLLDRKISMIKTDMDSMSSRINAIRKRSDFLDFVNKGEKSVLMVDFDNVIHNMTKHWHDGTIYGEPIEGTEDALKSLSEKFDLIIYTCKANPERPLVNNMTGIELIWEWLDKYGLKKYIKDITFDKLNAVAYIDDKAVKFTSWKDCFQKLEKENLL